MKMQSQALNFHFILFDTEINEMLACWNLLGVHCSRSILFLYTPHIQSNEPLKLYYIKLH